jgi:hypothetical protein
MESVYSKKTQDLEEENQRRLERKQEREVSKKRMQGDIKKRAMSWRNPNLAAKCAADDTSESTIQTNNII